MRRELTNIINEFEEIVKLCDEREHIANDIIKKSKELIKLIDLINDISYFKLSLNAIPPIYIGKNSIKGIPDGKIFSNKN